MFTELIVSIYNNVFKPHVCNMFCTNMSLLNNSLSRTLDCEETRSSMWIPQRQMVPFPKCLEIMAGVLS